MANLSQKLFQYPIEPHSHRHGPSGYKNYQEYKPWLRDEFTFMCVYCLVRERWGKGGHRAFSVEHVTPRKTDPNRSTDYGNLIYACLDCNSLRQDRAVLNPFSSSYAHHVRIADNGTIQGLTPAGVAHVKTLCLDSEELTEFRQRIIQTVRSMEATNTAPALTLLLRWIGFPEDLPDLATKRPPGGNTRPEAAKNCYYQQRRNGRLPYYY